MQETKVHLAILPVLPLAPVGAPTAGPTSTFTLPHERPKELFAAIFLALGPPAPVRAPRHGPLQGRNDRRLGPAHSPLPLRTRIGAPARGGATTPAGPPVRPVAEVAACAVPSPPSASCRAPAAESPATAAGVEVGASGGPRVGRGPWSVVVAPTLEDV